MITKHKEINTPFAKYFIAEMNCPICELDASKPWGECLKRDTVYLPEIPELVTRYVRCMQCYVVYAQRVVLGYELYVRPSLLDVRCKISDKEVFADPERCDNNLCVIQKNYGALKNFSLLDVGCAHGEFVALTQTSGIRAAGVEIRSDFAAVARERTRASIYEGDITRLPISEHYDVVTTTEVLEHVIDPNVFIRALYKILRPGGMLFLTTSPNISSLKIKYLGCNDRLIRNTFTHHVLYSPKSMSFFLRKHGFGNIRFHHYQRKQLTARNVLMRLINICGYFDNQVIVTAWKK